MNGQTSVEKLLLAFLRENAYVAGELEPATDLIEAGVLDSLLVADLVLFVESSFGIGLNPGNISPKHFRNVECLARLIVEKREKARVQGSGFRVQNVASDCDCALKLMPEPPLTAKKRRHESPEP